MVFFFFYKKSCMGMDMYMNMVQVSVDTGKGCQITWN